MRFLFFSLPFSPPPPPPPPQIILNARCQPSRRTTHQTFDLLREYCLGDEPVGFQVISDQSASLVGRRGTVNYEDPNYSVGLPVFAIHGNHDDPTREGGDEALAALDLLSVTNFVNYFGKADKVDDVTIKPILMKKGATKVRMRAHADRRGR